MTMFKTKESKRPPHEYTIELWLEEGDDGRMYLHGKDEDGKTKVILVFRLNGRIHFLESAQLRGLDTNSDGQIIIDDGPPK